MNKYVLFFAVIGLTIVGCSSKNDPFTISEGKVGKFHKADAIKYLYEKETHAVELSVAYLERYGF